MQLYYFLNGFMLLTKYEALTDRPKYSRFKVVDQTCVGSCRLKPTSNSGPIRITMLNDQNI